MKDSIVDIFAFNLRRYRTEKNLSQRDLSYLTEVINNADISRMENGRINITLKTLEELANSMDIYAWELLVPREYR